MMISSSGLMAQQQKGVTLEPQTLIAYTVCIMGGFVVYQLVAEQAFSSVLTLSAFAQLLSFVLIGLQINASQSVAGISGRTMTLQAVMLCLRLSSTLFQDGYLPVDKTGDHVYQLADICTLLMVLKVLHCIYKTHSHTYNAKEDTLNVKNMVIGCVLLAVAIHPDLNDWPAVDIAWAASLYIDTIAMLPQLWMCNTLGSVPSYTAHYLAATLAKNFFSACFWYHGAENIARIAGAEGWFMFCPAAAMVVLAHVLQFLMLADFAIYYVKAGVSGTLTKGGAVTVNYYDI